MEIERSTRLSGSLEHAAETRERVMKAIAGLTTLLDQAESLHIDVAARRKSLRVLETEWKSGA